MDLKRCSIRTRMIFTPRRFRPDSTERLLFIVDGTIIVWYSEVVRTPTTSDHRRRGRVPFMPCKEVGLFFITRLRGCEHRFRVLSPVPRGVQGDVIAAGCLLWRPGARCRRDDFLLRRYPECEHPDDSRIIDLTVHEE